MRMDILVEPGRLHAFMLFSEALTTVPERYADSAWLSDMAARPPEWLDLAARAASVTLRKGRAT